MSAPRELLRLARGARNALVVRVAEHKGTRYVDLRLLRVLDSGEERPTIKGCTLRARELDSVIEALKETQRALATAPPAQVPPRGPRPQRGQTSHARFATTCPACAAVIRPGELVRTIGGVPHHAACSEGA